MSGGVSLMTLNRDATLWPGLAAFVGGLGAVTVGMFHLVGGRGQATVGLAVGPRAVTMFGRF